MTVAGVVAGAFRRLPGDTNTLYVVTAEGMLNPINGTLFEGGKVVAVDTTSFLDDSKPSNDLVSPQPRIPFSTQQPVDKEGFRLYLKVCTGAVTNINQLYHMSVVLKGGREYFS